MTDTTPRVARVRHYRGERLVGGDLQQEYDAFGEWRGLHVVALHDTWGIALGFDVNLDPAVGVFVGPGLAYDCRGREIVLTSSYAFPWPRRPAAGAPPTEYDLVICYDAALGRRQIADLAGLCDARAGREQPLFAWRRPEETRLGMEVPLARARLGGNAPPSIALDVRRYAARLSRPHVVSGITPIEQPWTIWTLDPDDERILGIATTVDTQSAGFVGVPYYFVTPRLDVSTFASTSPVHFRWLTSIAAETRTGFEFRIAFATHADPDIRTLAARTKAVAFNFALRLAWLGVEPVSGCAPEVEWIAVRNILRRLWRLPLLERQEGIHVD